MSKHWEPLKTSEAEKMTVLNMGMTGWVAGLGSEDVLIL